MSLPYPDKSQTPTLDSTVTMTADLWGFWWFGEASGVTIKDWSHFGNHMMVTGISDASWVDHGTNQWSLKVNQKGYSHPVRNRANGRPAISVGDAYSCAFLLRIDEIGERGSIAGFDDWGRFQFWQTGAQTRIYGRGEAAGDRRFDYYNGFVWEVDISSSASGQLDLWVITADGSGNSGVRFYKNGEFIHGPSRNNWFQTGTAGWLLEGGSDTLGCQGELVMFGEWGRELTLADVNTLMSEPFQVLGYTPAAPGGGGSTVTDTHSVGPSQPQIWAMGAPKRNVIAPGAMDSISARGHGRSQSHILDWLGGAD